VDHTTSREGEDALRIDDKTLKGLLVESQDLQADAMRDVHSTLPDLRDIGADRRGRPVDLDRIRAYNTNRRDLLKKGGFGIGGLAARGLLGGAFGSTLLGIVAKPASAQADIDIQILQTASSLENLAVATYGAALGLDFIQANATVTAFAETTMMQHSEHSKAFNAQSESLGGEQQMGTSPKYQPVVDKTLPTLTDALKVAEFAAVLEEVATDTYVANMSLFEDTRSKEIMASVMGVEAQHLATLRAVIALLQNDLGNLVTIPTDVASLPAAAGSVAFPMPFNEPDMASPPEEGAVQ
jgi:hypothetical protein